MASLQQELREKVGAAMAASQKPQQKEFKPEEHKEDGGKLKPGPGRESFKLAAFWYGEVRAYEQYNARWYERGNKVLKRYRDERSKLETQGMRRMNILWATTKIMKPAIYSRCPDPIVDRKFLDRDPTGRLSSVMLERVIRSQLENNYHSAMNRAVYDRLLPGRGQIWVRYEPEYGEGSEEPISIPAQSGQSMEDNLAKIAKDVNDPDLIKETSSDEELGSTGTTLLAEKIVCDYIDWRDFYIFPAKARTWEEVQAVGKKVFMSKAECVERFDETIGRDLRPDTTPESSRNQQSSAQATDTTIFRDVTDRNIVVWEIWNKSDKRVYWISEGYDYLCDVREDPYKLKRFFPCPEPLSATTTNDTLTPVPDYYEYQDQAIQIDELTQRIAMLTRACKVAGAYNAANKALSRIFEETTENQLIPVDQWAMFADQGGVKGAMDFVPLDQIQSCIETLQTVRQSAMQDLDQVTGISDIVRGTSDSRETLGGIRLKNNNAGTRLSESQTDVQRFARDIIELIGELAAKHFSDDTLIEASGILYDEEMDPETIMREFEPQMPGFDVPKPYQQGNPLQGDNDPSKGKPMQPGGAPSMPSAPPMGAPPAQNPAAASSSAQGKTPSPNAVPPVDQTNIVPFPMVGDPNVINSQMATPIPSPDILILEKINKAIELLRNDVPRGYRISIETDSTIFGDKVQERQDASDFVEAIGGFMTNFENLTSQVPEAMPLMARTLQWAVRKFRIGRDLESEINSFVSRMEKKAKLLIENPQPSIEDRKLEADKEKNKADNQVKIQLAQMDAQRQEQDDMRQAQIQQANDERDAQKAQQEDMRTAELAKLDLEIKREELNFRREENRMKLEMMAKQMEMEYQKTQLKAHSEQQSAQMNAQSREHEHMLNKDAAEHSHSLNMEASEAQHSQKMQQTEVAHQGLKQKAELQESAHEQKRDLMDHTAKHKKQQMEMKTKQAAKPQPSKK